MENRELLRVFLGYVLDCDPVSIGLWHGTNPANQVIQEIDTGNFQYNFIIGFDQPHECWLDVDQWLISNKKQHKVFLLDENFLNQEKNKQVLGAVKSIAFNHDLLSNLSSMRDLHCLYDFDCTTHTSSWLFLSRAKRPHRQYFIDTWIDQLESNLIYSDGQQQTIGNVDFYTDGVASYVCNAKNLLNLVTVYNQASASVVAETSVSDFLTEKTFHAIMALHPILMIGPRGAVAHLRDHGFDMFDDLLNHSYDSVEYWSQRIDCMVQDNIEVLKNGINRRNIADRLLANQQRIADYYNQSVVNTKQQILQTMEQ